MGPIATELSLLWLAAATAALVVAGAVLLWAGRDLTFLQDEWAFIYFRQGGTADAYLAPHNEHLLLIPVAIYKVLFATVGLHPYWPYRVMVVGGHLACLVLFFTVARRSVGPRLAALVTLPFLFFGAAWEVVLFPFNVQWILSMAAFLGILLLLERRDKTAEVACGLLVALAIASSSLGVAIAAGVLVEVLWYPDRWRRIWIPVIPLLLYGLWTLDYNRHPAYQGPRNFPPSPRYVFEAAAGAVGALLGASIGNRVPRLLVVAVDLVTAAVALALAWLLGVRRRLSARLAMLIVVAGVNWTALAITRSYVDAASSRYVYAGGIFVALIALELARGRSIGRRATVVVALVACGACVLNLAWLVRNADHRREQAIREAAVLTGLELSRGHVDPSFRPRLAPPTEILVAGLYFRATDAFGDSPAMSPAELAKSPDYARTEADLVLLRAFRFRLIPYIGKGGPPGTHGTACRAPARGLARVEVTVPPGGLVVRAAGRAEVRLRRFGDTYRGAPVGAAGRKPRFLASVSDRASAPWRAEITSGGAFEVYEMGPGKVVRGSSALAARGPALVPAPATACH